MEPSDTDRAASTFKMEIKAHVNIAANTPWSVMDDDPGKMINLNDLLVGMATMFMLIS